MIPHRFRQPRCRRCGAHADSPEALLDCTLIKPQVWTEEQIATLRGHWDAGLSAQQIARRLGMTKGAVIGKARRLRVPARPSPIRRSDAPEVSP
jgi:hypothetical protein